MATSARPQIAEEDNRSRWDRARLRLVLAIGVTAVVAIVCLVAAVLTSARRADEASLDRERQLIAQAIAERGALILREVESVAATPGATQAIRATTIRNGSSAVSENGWRTSSAMTSWSWSTAPIGSNTRVLAPPAMPARPS